jgi:Leucine-rich repeat (LRR) protein
VLLENQLTSLDLSKHTKLVYLEAGANKLTSIDLSKNIDLELITISENQLTSLDLSNNTNLLYLDVEDNKLTTLDVSKNIKLEELHVPQNELTTLDVSRNPNLEWLQVQYNFMSSESDVIGFNGVWDGEDFAFSPQRTTTPIRNAQRSDSRYGIKFTNNIVSEKVEMKVVLPNNEKAEEAKIVIYDNLGSVMVETSGKSFDTFTWNLANKAGRTVANGTYLIVAEAKGTSGKTYRYSAKLGVKK